MPEGLAKNLEKSLEKVTQKITEFEKRAKSSVDSLQDAKDIEKVWKGVQQELISFQSLLERVDASKLFPKDVKTNIESAEAAAKKYVAALEKAKTTEAFQNKLGQKNKNTSELKTTTELYNKETKKLQQQKAVLDNLQRLWTDEVEQSYQKQQEEIRKTSGELEKQKEILKSLKAEQQKLKDEGVLTSSSEVSKKGSIKAKSDFENASAELSSAKSAQKVAKSNVTKYENAHKGQDLSKDKEYTALLKAREAAIERCAKAQKDYNVAKQVFDKFARAGTISGEISNATTLQEELKKTSESAKEAARELSGQKESLDKAQKGYSAAEKMVEGYSQSIEELKQKDKELDVELKNIQADEAKIEWQELLNVIKEFMKTDLASIVHDMESFVIALEQYKAKEIEKLPDVLEEINAEAQPIAPAMKKIGDSIEDVGDSTKELTKAQQEVENLKNQVMDFFSITNSIQLFKRAVSSAMDTIKELDATMTEAAVVTEFDVGEMWEKLPQYSKETQKLGVSINGMYQATTLYYQQGLKTNEAMQLGVETMKMAKIAGMESAEATQAMTAALRGFNMALNETSAVRVNDVYSQLAAVTAADTNQIATAMEKTASIAASANMEFETTAALLAQIIETTQEAPETAGTAMKTIIARFSEVKSLKEQGLSSGTDSEGEAIDVNKIQTALRSVGISMEGYFQGTEGLDSILLKLSEKWGTLDFETQRYIATMAAGSRQQSRFIAMMSDYGRTTELVGAAQNSAGASQKQFQKTQESLETSLTKLKNAWDQFLMGLANNEVLKFGVDVLTTILETINKITDAISGGSGLTKSIISLIGVVSALKGGKALLNSQISGNLFGGFGGETGYTETITKSTDKDGNVVESIVRKPSKQGERAGIQAGNGFVGGFTKAIKNNRAGEKGAKAFMKNVFTNQFTDQKKLKEKIMDINAADGSPLKELQKDLEAGKISAEQAAGKMEELGCDVSELRNETQATVPNVKALGTAIVGVGSAVSLLANLFDKWGMKEVAEDVKFLSSAITLIGTAFTLLAPVIKSTANVLIEKGWEVQAAWWWVALIALAVMAIIAAVVYAIKKANENSIDSRLKAAAEATEKAKQAAEEAKQAYNDLLSDIEGYENIQEELNNLTAGTKAWTEALHKNNEEVMDLLTKYSDLAQFLKVGENGELEFDPEGFERLKEEQEKRKEATQSEALIAVFNEEKLKTEKEQENAETGIYNKAFSEGMTNYGHIIEDGAQYGISYYQFEALKRVFEGKTELTRSMESDLETSAALSIPQIRELWEKREQILAANGDNYSNITYSEIGTYGTEEVTRRLQEAYKANKGLFGDNEALNKLSKELGYSVDDLKSFGEVIVNWDKGINTIRNNMQAQISAMLNSRLTPEELKNKTSDEAVTFVSKYFGADGKKTESGTGGLSQNDIYDKKGSSDVDNENLYLKQLGKKYEYDFGNEKDDKKNLQGLYKKMSGKTDDEIKDMSKEELAKAIAELANADYAEEQVRSIMNKLGALSTEKQKLYGAAISGDLTGLSGEELNQMSSLDKELIADYFELEGEQRQAFLNDFQNNVQQAIQIEQGKIQEAKKRAEDLGFQNNIENFNKASAKALNGYLDLIEQSISTGGKDILENGFEKLFSKASDEQDKKIMAFMENAEWTKEGTGEDFLKLLETLGLDIEETIPNGEDFIEQLKIINALYKKFEIGDIFNKVTNGIKEAHEISQQSELTTEQFDKYLREGLIDAEEWSFNGSGWVNITSGMSTLAQAIRDNTIATYNLSKKEAETQKQFYESKNTEIMNTSFSFQKDSFSGKIVPIYGSTPAYGYSKINNDELFEILKNNTAIEEVWKKFFSSQEKYDIWRELANGGIITLENFLAASKNFDVDKVEAFEKLENPYDKFYNTTQKINAELREREKLERRYQTLMDRGVATQQELSRLRTQQLESLEQERAMREGLLQARYNQVGDITSQYSDVAGYASYDKTTGAITIDYNAIDRLAQTGQSDELDRVTEYIGKLEDQQGLIEDELNAILDIEDAVWEIYAQGEDEYFDIINRVKEALIADRQKEIDKLTEINDSINDTNSKIISNMQKQIEQQRQQKENQKTEDSIQDKIYQLEYLKQDSSGANAIAILELEEQIKQEQEDHLANLVDQGIQNLQEQNDQAYEQRQTQIDIMQEQLDHWAKSEGIWNEVHSIINKGFNEASGKIVQGSELERILSDETTGMSQLQKVKLTKDLEDGLALANSYLKEGGAAHTEFKTGEQVKFTNAEGTELTGTMNKNGDVDIKDANGNVIATYSGNTLAKGINGKYSSTMTATDAANKAKEVTYDPNQDNKGSGNTDANSSFVPVEYLPLDNFDMGNIVAQAIYNQNGWTINKLKKAVASNGKSIEFTDDPHRSGGYRVAYNGQEISPFFGGNDSEYSYDNYINDSGIYTYKRFKTGGLADFTGPAWLDGTKSRPEYILNADQTKAFFQLVDVLSGLKTDSSTSQNTGNYNYDIDINVEKIEKEEDLEMISRKIEDMIVDSIRYRGNNIL